MGMNTQINPTLNQNLSITNDDLNIGTKLNEIAQDSNCIMVSNIPNTINKEEIESYFVALATQCHTKVPEEVQYISAFKTAYVVFPSVENAKKIWEKVNGTICLDGVTCNLEFYQMNLSKNKSNSKELTLVQDWFCDRCEYKNFAKRIKCKKCENPRNHNCKVVYNSPAIVKIPNQGSGQYYNISCNDMFLNSVNTSIMIRGHG